MVLADMIYTAGVPAGYVLIEDPTNKERRFCKKKGIDIVEADAGDLLTAARFVYEEELGKVREVGC